MIRLTLGALNAFLVEAKAHVQRRPTQLRACLGNESCDLDSAASAIVRAFVLSTHGSVMSRGIGLLR